MFKVGDKIVHYKMNKYIYEIRGICDDQYIYKDETHHYMSPVSFMNSDYKLVPVEVKVGQIWENDKGQIKVISLFTYLGEEYAVVAYFDPKTSKVLWATTLDSIKQYWNLRV
jgi:hypothetical protein